jgi:hypothetical protein
VHDSRFKPKGGARSGKFLRRREPATIDNQTVTRLNRDTLYSSAMSISTPICASRCRGALHVHGRVQRRPATSRRWSMARIVKEAEVEFVDDGPGSRSAISGMTELVSMPSAVIGRHKASLPDLPRRLRQVGEPCV